MRFAPEVYTAKVQESKAFYCDLLGFRVKKELEGFVVLQHAAQPEYEILFCVPNSPFVHNIFRPAYNGQGIIWQIEVGNVVAEYDRLHNVTPVALELVREPENGRHFTITDPNGILIDIVQYVMGTTVKITELFGANLAALLADKIVPVYTEFDKKGFIAAVDDRVKEKTYTQRIEIIAEELRHFLPQNYSRSLAILMQILGPENPNETGMFREFYWLMPVGKYIEKYGLDDFDESMQAIAEVTKRNTGEYAVRPYIRSQPQNALKYLTKWAKSDNFHLRRLASEGLRPKLPWAPKLDTFVDDPAPVFAILETLKEDPVKFVQKSVANHVTDYLKVNPEPTRKLIDEWRKSDNTATQWIVRHATRKIS